MDSRDTPHSWSKRYREEVLGEAQRRHLVGQAKANYLPRSGRARANLDWRRPVSLPRGVRLSEHWAQARRKEYREMTNILPEKRGRPSRRTVSVLAATIALALLLGIGVRPHNADAQSSDFVFKRKSDPARTVVTNSNGRWLATFTDDTYTVSLKGPSRTFSEATAANVVKSTTWVRVLPEPFDGQVDKAWLRRALANTKPDVLQKAMQYTEGAPRSSMRPV